MAIHREQIFEIADALVAQGTNPTLAAVRKALGKGSFTTIQEVMVEWRAERATQHEPSREAPPRAVEERLQLLGGEIWAAALEMANARLAADREALEARRLEMEQRQAEAAEMADQMAEELETLKDQAGKLEEESVAWKQEKISLESEVSRLSALLEKNKALHAAADERADDFRLKALSLDNMLEKERKESMDLREAMAGWRSRCNLLEEQNKILLGKVGPISMEEPTKGKGRKPAD